MKGQAIATTAFLYLLCLTPIAGVEAQLLPDNTLGAEGSVINPIDLLNDRIDGGASRGINLFHSFLEFNIGNNRGVYFANPIGIENILTRVTGSNPSNIFGTLGVLGNANLFLMNPNGIYFGPNARLDVSGSFLATTADGIQLGTQGYFSATDIPGSQLLAVKPEALFSNALRNHQAQINNRGNLAVGGDLTLVADELDLQGQLAAGGNLTLVGANLANSPWNLPTNSQKTPSSQGTVRIRDSATSPFIVAAEGELLVQGNEEVDIFALNHPDSGLYAGGDMVLRSGNPVGGDAHYYTGGSFRIEQLDGSLGDLLSPFDPVIRASGDVSFDSYTGASLHIFAGGSVTIAGNVRITGADPTNFINETVTLSDGTTVNIDGSIRPTLDIRAGTTAHGAIIPTCTGCPPTPTLLLAGTNPSGANIQIGGEVRIDQPDGQVFLTNQYNPNPSLANGTIQVNTINTRVAMGNSGDVAIDARGDTIVTNRISTSTANRFSIGNAGKIEILTQSFFGMNNASLAASTLGRGNGGNIRIQARDTVSFNDGGVFSQVTPRAVGNGGDIEIVTGSLLLTNDAQLSTSTLGQGNGGNIRIQARDTVSFDDGGVFSSVWPGAVGNSGDVEIVTGSLSLTNTAEVSTSTLGQGNGGNIHINARDTISSNDGFIGSQVRRGAVGNSGNVEIVTGSLLLTNNAQLSTSTGGQGNGGNIRIQARDTLASDEGGVFSSVWAGAVGNSGDIEIVTGSLLLTNDARVSANTVGQGNGGNIRIQARDTITLDNGLVISQVLREAVGNSGDIEIVTGSLSLTNSAEVSTVTNNRGNAGNVSINARDTVSLDGIGSTIRSLVGFKGQGNGGNVEIVTGSLFLTNDALVNTNTLSQGNGGDIRIQARDTITLDDGDVVSQVRPRAVGDGGDIEIVTGSLFLTNTARVSTSTLGQGDGGNIRIQARDTVSSNDGNIFSQVSPEAVGNGGDIEIGTSSLFLTNEAQVNTGTFGRSNAGSVRINARDTVSLDGIFSGIGSRVELNGQGNGGNIEIDTGSLSITNRALLTSSTFGRGDAGGIKLNARDTISFDEGGAFSEVAFGAVGNSGDIEFDTGSLVITNSSFVIASVNGRGNSGNIRVNARNTVSLDRGSLVSSEILPGGAGSTGNIDVATGSLSIANGAHLSSSTGGQGNAGNVRINARDTVSLDGVGDDGLSSSIFSLVGPEAVGNGGNVEIAARLLSLTNGAQIDVNTFGKGNAGNVRIDTRDTVSLTEVGSNGNPSAVFSGVGLGGEGKGGDIDISTSSLLLTNGGQLNVSTGGKGDAGNIRINAREAVVLSGRGSHLLPDSVIDFFQDVPFFDSSGDNLLPVSLIASDVFPGAEGQGGSLQIATGLLSLADRGGLDVSSFGQGGAGDIDVWARSISLDQAAIFAQTISGDGGNIRLGDARLLLLRNGSFISTQAGLNRTGGGGNGGNIDIYAQFIVGIPLENSDITANAFDGRGGNIRITTNGIYGLQFRPRLTPLSDITASSEFGLNGSFDLNLLSFPAERGLNQLPTSPIDAESAFARDVCAIQGGKIAGGSSFTITGRGGLPPSPLETLTPLDGVVEWSSWDDEETDENSGRGRFSEQSLAPNDRSSTKPAQPPVRLRDRTPEESDENGHPKEIRPAQGWIIEPDGTVVLTEDVETATLYPVRALHPTCSAHRR